MNKTQYIVRGSTMGLVTLISTNVYGAAGWYRVRMVTGGTALVKPEMLVKA